MKIKFVSDAYYRGEKFASEGEIKEVSEELGFAKRWLRRGHIEILDEVDSLEEMLEEEIEEAIEEAVEEVKLDIDKMKKAELIELAKDSNIEIDASLKVKEIRELLKEKLEEVAEIL